MTEVTKNSPYQPHDEKADFYRINGNKEATVTLQDGEQIKGKLGRFFIQGAMDQSIIVIQGTTDVTVPLYAVRRIDLE